MFVSVGTPTAAAVGYEKGDVSDVLLHLPTKKPEEPKKLRWRNDVGDVTYSYPAAEAVGLAVAIAPASKGPPTEKRTIVGGLLRSPCFSATTHRRLTPSVKNRRLLRSLAGLGIGY